MEQLTYKIPPGKTAVAVNFHQLDTRLPQLPTNFGPFLCFPGMSNVHRI